VSLTQQFLVINDFNFDVMPAKDNFLEKWYFQ